MRHDNASEGEEMVGELLYWSRERGFGFIAVAGVRRNIFLHFGDCDGAAQEPPEAGDSIAFTLTETPRGPRALRAQIVKRAEPARR